MSDLEAQIMSGVRGQAEHVAGIRQIARTMAEQQRDWIADLRAKGVKAAHPDDGWVDRNENTVVFCYPQFDDGVQIGDLIALGWPQWGDRKPNTRIVKVIGKRYGYSKRWEFAALAGDGEAG